MTLFLLGLIASFQPCLFPILPTFVAHLISEETDGEQSNDMGQVPGDVQVNAPKKLNGFIASLLVTLGIMSVFTTLSLLSSNVLLYFSNRYLFFRSTQGIILIIFSVLMIMGSTLHLTLFDRMSTAANNAIDRIENPYVTSLVIGLLFTLLAAPCAFVIFGTAFTLIAGTTAAESVMLMAIFSLGAGTPFFILSGILPSVKDKIIRNRQSIQRKFTILSGVLIFIVGVYLTLDGFKMLPSYLTK